MDGTRSGSIDWAFEVVYIRTGELRSFPMLPFCPSVKIHRDTNEKSVWYLHSSTFQRNMANSLSAVVIDECNFAALLPPHFMRANFFLFK